MKIRKIASLCKARKTIALFKAALLSREPVRFLGARYDYVSAVIYRTCNGEVYITVELTDEVRGQTTLARAEQVERETAGM